MNDGKYIVLEGAMGVGKTTIADMLVHELQRLGLSVRKMQEPDAQADPTTTEIRRLTQDPKYPMNSRTEVLLYNAARSQSLEAVREARKAGNIVIVDRSYLTTLAVQFYGRGDIPEYNRLNDIIAFAVGDMWPDMTLVLDAPVDVLQKRVQKRGENERFDNLSAEMLERIRAGYLWEAKQRNMPVIYATGRADETFQDVWRYVAQLLGLSEAVVREPVAVADLLAKSPAAQVLKTKRDMQHGEQQTTYFVPPSLPDDIQCDYCDDIERILTARRKLAKALTGYMQKQGTTTDSESSAYARSLELLKSLLPVACAPEPLLSLLANKQQLQLPGDVLSTLPNAYSSDTTPVRLASVIPRNELDLLPAMLYEAFDMPMNEVKETVEKWPYEVKARLFLDYLQKYPSSKVLESTRFEFDLLTDLSALTDLSQELQQHVQLQALTPRYGYDMPPEIEAADLTDDYDAIFDQSLTLVSILQARGFTAESQYATLLGHKQRWHTVVSFIGLSDLIKSSTASQQQQILSAIETRTTFLHQLITRET
ncbi:dTMP kinase [Candidatus Saccharibacteria bacterium]|nr:MAG: dTMP kinase [Candidatus Saccharibacteria bacterium]